MTNKKECVNISFNITEEKIEDNNTRALKATWMENISTGVLALVFDSAVDEHIKNGWKIKRIEDDTSENI